MTAAAVLIDRADTWSGNPHVWMTNQPHREWVYRQAFQLGRQWYEMQTVLAAVDWFDRQLPETPIGVAGARCWPSSASTRHFVLRVRHPRRHAEASMLPLASIVSLPNWLSTPSDCCGASAKPQAEGDAWACEWLARNEEMSQHGS